MRIEDSLTGVAALNHVIDIGQQMIKDGSEITALVIGIDNFKQYNDSYGHLKANNILVEFGQVLKKRTEDYDAIVGRLGGDEFVILFKNYSNSNGFSLSEELNNSLSKELYQVDSKIEPLAVSYAIGEASSSYNSSISIHKLLQNAESNMEYNKYKNRKASNDFELSAEIFQSQADQLLKVLAEKDMYTYVHSQYTAKYAVALAEALNLSNNIVQNIYYAGWLHDIGKIAVTSDILRKPSRLQNDEYYIIKQHVTNGLNIISTFNFPETVKNSIQYHHERWDGKGYPNGILGTDTPIEGRILQITDAFSAMTVKRVYREQLSIEDALDELSKNSGSQFDPTLTNVFIKLLKNQKIAI